MVLRIIKPVVIGFILSGAWAAVHAAEWVLVYEGAGYRSEIDKSSFIRSGNIVQAWDRLIPPGGLAADEDGFTYRHIMTWSDYDCVSKRVSARRRIYVGQTPREIKEQNPIRQPIVSVTPGTPRERLWAAACGVAVKPQPVPNPAQRKASQEIDNRSAVLADAQAGQPHLLPNRTEADISPKPAPNMVIISPPKPDGKTAEIVRVGSTKGNVTPSATAPEKKPVTVVEKPKQSETPQNVTQRAASQKPAPSSPDKQPETLYRYIRNQLQSGGSGEIIIVTSEKKEVNASRSERKQPRATRGI